MYARKLGECLLQLNDKEHCSALQDLQRWITELTTLGACITFGNPELLKAIQSGSLDDSGSPVQQLTDSFYADVLVGATFCPSMHLVVFIASCVQHPVK